MFISECFEPGSKFSFNGMSVFYTLYHCPSSFEKYDTQEEIEQNIMRIDDNDRMVRKGNHSLAYNTNFSSLTNDEKKKTKNMEDGFRFLTHKMVIIDRQIYPNNTFAMFIYPVKYGHLILKIIE
jgi:hypothetical protein